MVLQRWQTVLLLLSLVLMVVFIFAPMGTVFDLMSPQSATLVFVCDNVGFLILNIVIAVLLLIDIFLFRNLKAQMAVAAVAMVLMAASAGLGFSFIYLLDGFRMSLFSTPLVVAALVLTWFARRFMRKDQRLLAAADRLR